MGELTKRLLSLETPAPFDPEESLSRRLLKRYGTEGRSTPIFTTPGETAVDVLKQAATGLAQGAIDLPIGIGLLAGELGEKAGITKETPEEGARISREIFEATRIRPEAKTGLGAMVGGVAEFLTPTGVVGGLIKAPIKARLKGELSRRLLATGGSFAGGEAILKSGELAVGDITIEQFAKDVGLTGLTGVALGGAGAIPGQSISARTARLMGEWAALTETRPIVEEQRFANREEALYGAILLGGFKGMEAGLARLAKRRAVSVEEIRAEEKTTFEETGKFSPELAAEIKAYESFKKEAFETLEKDVAEARTRIEQKGAERAEEAEEAKKAREIGRKETPRVEPQIPQEAEKEVIKPFPSAPAEPIAPPVPIPGIKSAGAGKGIFYTAERTVGDIKKGPSLGIYLTNDVSVAKNYAGQQGQVHTVTINIKNPLKITSVNKEFPEIFSTEEINQILANAGVKYKFTDTAEQEFFRFADDGGTAFIKAVKNAGYDAIRFPDLQGNKIFATTLVFDKQNMKDLAPSAPPAKPPVVPEETLTETRGAEGAKLPRDILQEQIAKAEGRAEGEAVPAIPDKGMGFLVKEKESGFTIRPVRDEGAYWVYLDAQGKEREMPKPVGGRGKKKIPGQPYATHEIIRDDLSISTAELNRRNEERIQKTVKQVQAEKVATAPKPPIPQAGITAESLAEKYPEASIKVKPTKEGYTGQAEYEKATYTVTGKTEAEVLEKLGKRLASVVPYEEPQLTALGQLETRLQKAKTPEEQAEALRDIQDYRRATETPSGGRPPVFKSEVERTAFAKLNEAQRQGNQTEYLKQLEVLMKLGRPDLVFGDKPISVLQQPKRVISDIEVEERAEKMSVTEAQEKAAQVVQGELTTAQRVLQKEYHEKLGKFQDAIPDSLEITEANAPEILKTLKTLGPEVLASGRELAAPGSEAGRTLRKAEVKALKFEAIESLLARLEKESPKRQAEFMQRYKQIEQENPAALERFIEYSKLPNFWDYLYEYWYSSILSGLTTHLVNVTSNSLWTGWQIPHRFFLATADIPASFLGGRPRQYTFSDAFALWNGYKRAIKDGTAKTWEIIRKAGQEDTKWKLEQGTSFEAWERSPRKPLRLLGKLIGLPGRALRMEDLFFKGIAWRGEIEVQASRLAWEKATAEKLKGPELQRRVAELIEELSSKPTPEMMEKAGTFAQYVTFNDAPNRLTNAFLSLRNAVPGSRFLIPFVNTISNLLQRGLEVTPGIGIGIGRLAGQDAATVAAKQMEGVAAITLLWLAAKYVDGEMTGAAPQDKAEREAFFRQGKLPWSFGFTKPNGERVYLSYRRIEPANTLFGAVASFGDAFRDNAEAPTNEQVASLVIRLGKNLLDGSYLSQFNQFITAINMGDRGIESTSKLAQRFTTSFLPFSSALRSTARATEAMEEGEVVLRQPKTTGEAIRETIPFVSKTAFPKREVTGREVVIQGGPFRQFLPYKFTVAEDDIVEKELQSIKKFPGMPQRTLDGVEMTGAEYDRLVKRQGDLWRPALYRMMRTPGWKNLNIAQKERVINKLIDTAREQARNQARMEKVLGRPIQKVAANAK